MSESFFSILSSTDGFLQVDAGEHTAGPWSPSLQHGGPPNSLAVREADRALRANTGRDDFVALRLAADFVGPVPLGTIEVHTEVARAARSAGLVNVRITGGGRDCLHVRVWFVRDADTSALVRELPTPVTVPENGPSLGTETFGYGAALQWSFVGGAMTARGPAAAWARSRMPLLDDGTAATGLACVALVADSAGGISAELDWSQWSFANVDLDVHLARPFLGEWVLLDAATTLGAHGSALARSTLSDVHGVAGAGLQTLVVAPIPTR